VRTIWLVEGGEPFEQTYPIRAYERQEDAEHLMVRLQLHSSRKPQLSPGTPFTGEAYEAYCQQLAKWAARCPVKGSTFSEFSVTEVVLYSPRIPV